MLSLNCFTIVTESGLRRKRTTFSCFFKLHFCVFNVLCGRVLSELILIGERNSLVLLFLKQLNMSYFPCRNVVEMVRWVFS